MSAGLPGLGLGGLFFILSALVAPAIEVGRMVAGRSSPARRREVARQFALALAMVVAIDLTLRAVLLAGSFVGATSPPEAELIVLPLAPIGITTGLLLFVVAAAKLAELALRPRARTRRRGTRTIRVPRSRAGET